MKMEKNLQLITEPEKLMAWLDNNDLLLTLYEKEAKVLLGYLVQILIQHFFTVYDRTDLQQIESSGFIMFAT